MAQGVCIDVIKKDYAYRVLTVVQDEVYEEKEKEDKVSEARQRRTYLYVDQCT